MIIVSCEIRLNGLETLTSYSTRSFSGLSSDFRRVTKIDDFLNSIHNMYPTVFLVIEGKNIFCIFLLKSVQIRERLDFGKPIYCIESDSKASCPMGTPYYQ